MTANDSIYRLSLAREPGQALPLVFDSPHSGLSLPPDMLCAVPANILNTGWDAYVDELWQSVPSHGGALLAAQFHRTYIDVNRDLDDIDLDLLVDESWPASVKPSEAGMRGMGLIRRYALPDVPMYSRKLTAAEVEHRIRNYYLPYHAALRNLIGDFHMRFDQVWHINCHSMKSVGNAMNADTNRARPDMVVSDVLGKSAAPEFTSAVVDLLREFGYHVVINSPYEGGAIVRRNGAPSEGRHSVQIEINRRLYLNEQTHQKHAGFYELQSNLSIVVAKLASYVRSQIRQREVSGAK